MNKPYFEGCGTALVTPFTEDYKVDYDAYAASVDRQVKAGVHFLVPLATTGETPTLNAEEKKKLFDESRSAFLVTSLFGASAVYSLQSGLVELQQASVRRAAFVSPVVRRSRERGDHRLGAQRVARRALRRLPPRRPPPLRAAPRLAGRSSLHLPSSQLSARGRPYPSPAGHAALPLALDSAPLGLLASRFPVSTKGCRRPGGAQIPPWGW